MLTSKLPENERDQEKVQPQRTGRGTASVIARLNEQSFSVEPSMVEIDGQAANCETASGETPA